MLSQTFCSWVKQQSAGSNTIQFSLTLKCTMHQIFPLLRLFLSLELNLGICRHQQLPLPGREEQLLTTQLIMRLDNI